MSNPSPDVLTAFSGVRLLALDVDGVLTDGKIRILDDGSECVAFHVHDGWGLKQLTRVGIHLAAITGRDVEAVKIRCRSLGIPHVFAGVEDKVAVLEGLLTELSLTAGEACFMGDDLPDLGVMERCGLAVTVPGARPEIREISRYVTNSPQGGGAVREVCELILRAQGHWDGVLARSRGTSAIGENG